jgi:hypothetical protein
MGPHSQISQASQVVSFNIIQSAYFTLWKTSSGMLYKRWLFCFSWNPVEVLYSINTIKWQAAGTFEDFSRMPFGRIKSLAACQVADICIILTINRLLKMMTKF